MNFEKFLDSYKNSLIEEYKKVHPEAKSLSDEEILLMNPLSPSDIYVLKNLYLNRITKKLEMTKEEIDELEQDMKTASSMEKTELRQDIRYNYVLLQKYSKMIEDIQAELEDDRRNIEGNAR